MEPSVRVSNDILMLEHALKHRFIGIKSHVFLELKEAFRQVRNGIKNTDQRMQAEKCMHEIESCYTYELAALRAAFSAMDKKIIEPEGKNILKKLLIFEKQEKNAVNNMILLFSKIGWAEEDENHKRFRIAAILKVYNSESAKSMELTKSLIGYHMF